MSYNYCKYFAEMDYYNSTVRKGGQPLPLSINAQNFRKKIRNIGAVDLTDEKLWSKKNEIILKTALFYNQQLFPADINYINNKICHHVAFDLPLDNSYLGSIGFYENILQDKEIPTGTKNIISILLATTKGNKDDLLPEEKNADINYRHKYIELWYEMLNLTRQKI